MVVDCSEYLETYSADRESYQDEIQFFKRNKAIVAYRPVVADKYGYLSLLLI
jgi:hypothetical protein